eukprot:jgi/Ulvmu1/504/UM001_0512.1
MRQPRHIIVLDAGSTGSRIHIFSYLPAADIDRYPQLSLSSSFDKVEPGLSSFEDNPTAAGPHLRPLLDLATSKVQDDARAQTPFLLMATAGLRMLPDTAARSILRSCQHEILRAGFQQASTAVISGVQEGLYAWLSVNYVKNALPQIAALRRAGSKQDTCFHSQVRPLHPNRKFVIPRGLQEPVSVAEMGGASLQITIAGGELADGAKCQDLFAPIVLPHTPLDGCSLLTHSFMGYGREEALKRVSAAEPAAIAHCSHKDYEYAPGQFGVGAFDLCAGAITAVLFPEAGSEGPDDSDGGPCSCGDCDGGATIPRIAFPGRLMATENFARAVAGLNLPEDTSLRELAEAGSRHCAMPWATVAQALPESADPTGAAKVCFTVAYTVVFMQEVLSVGVDERRVHWANALVLDNHRRVHLDWPLGAALEHLVGTAAADAHGPAPPRLQEIAFWMLLAALLLACLTWIRLLFPGRCALLAAQVARVLSRLGCSSPGCASPTSSHPWPSGSSSLPRALPDTVQIVANRFLGIPAKAKRSQDLTTAM